MARCILGLGSCWSCGGSRALRGREKHVFSPAERTDVASRVGLQPGVSDSGIAAERVLLKGRTLLSSRAELVGAREAFAAAALFPAELTARRDARRSLVAAVTGLD